ncbi:hypothetical protein FS749_016112 [Ceratobasidium sp. UAMH 11750]|nr:hypothetical protein FS749_016112 [Ceratobasidium sp. UAMH 11750]
MQSIADSDSDGSSHPTSPAPTSPHPVPAHAGVPAVSDDDTPGPQQQQATGPVYHLNDAQRDWIIEEHYARFHQVKGKRGNQSAENGKTYAHNVVAPAFLKRWHRGWDQETQAEMLPAIQKVRDLSYHEQLVVYNFFNNSAKKDPDVQALKAAVAPSSAPAKKVNPENEWAREHSDWVNVEMVRRAGPQVKSSKTAVGLRRTVVTDVFKSLDPPERALWQNRAAEKRAKQVAQGRLPAAEHKAFIDGFVSDLRQLTNSAHLAVGMSFTGFFSFETIESDRPTIAVQSYTTPDIIEYVKSEEFGDSEARFSQWYRLEKGASVSGLPPAPDVIPDVDNFYRPQYPEEIGDKPKVHMLRKLNRHFANGEYNFYGGIGPVPWKEITDAYQHGDIKQWIPTWPNDIPFGDFNHLAYDDNLAIYRFFLRRQQGEPIDTCLWFARVFAGSIPLTQIDACSVSTVDIRGKEMHILHYNAPVSQPQSDRAIAFSEPSWRYFYHIGKQRSLDHWVGLGSVAYDPTSILISNETTAFVCSILEPADLELSRVVVNLIQDVNTMETHGPFKTTDGLWGITGALEPLPELLPASKPDHCASYADMYLREVWVKPSYAMSAFLAQKAGHEQNATVDFLLSWVDSLDSSSFVHGRSQTPQGGDGGFVWVILILIRLLLNTSVRTLQVSIPHPPPPDLDLTRLGDEHPRVVSCIHRLLEKASKAIKVLSASSHECVIVTEALVSHSDPADAPDPVNADDHDGSAAGELRGDVSGAASSVREAQRPAASGKAKQKRPAKVLSGKGKGSTKQKAASTFAALNVSDEERPRSTLDNSLFEPHAIPVDLDFEHRKNIFGRLSAQPTISDHTGTPQDLLVDIQKTVKQFNSALAEWRKFDDDYHPYPPQAIRHATRLSERDPRIKLRPIIAGILVQRYHLNRSRELWPAVVRLTQPLILASRTLTMIARAIENLSREGNPGPLRKKIKTFEPTIVSAIVFGREVAEALIHMEEISTNWANKLKNAWDNDIGLMDLTSIMTLAHGLADWRSETDNIGIKLGNIHLALRFAHEMPGKPVPLRYRVGCPAPEIFNGEANGRLQAYPAPPYPDTLKATDGNTRSGDPTASSTSTAPDLPDLDIQVSPAHVEQSNNPAQLVDLTMGLSTPSALPPQISDIPAAEGLASAITRRGKDLSAETEELVHQPPAEPATPVTATSTAVEPSQQPAVDPAAAPTRLSSTRAEVPDATALHNAGGLGTHGDGVTNDTVQAGGITVEQAVQPHHEGSSATESRGQTDGNIGAAVANTTSTGVAGPDGGAIAGGDVSIGARRSGRLSAKVPAEPTVVEKPVNARAQGKRRKRDEMEESLEHDDLEVLRMQESMQTSGAGGSGKQPVNTDGTPADDEDAAGVALQGHNASTRGRGGKRGRGIAKRGKKQ